MDERVLPECMEGDKETDKEMGKKARTKNKAALEEKSTGL